MTPSNDAGQVRLTKRWRMLLAAAGLGCLAPLAVAACLEPSSRGLGTHQQLGLPPCTSMWLFGVRCPSCGMTTAWSHAVRGHWVSAVGANAGGALLAVIAMLAGPWLLVTAAGGRWLAGPPGERAVAAGAMVVAIVTLIDWACRLAAG